MLLLKLLLKCIEYCLCYADFTVELSSCLSTWVSVKHSISCSDKCLSVMISMKCFFNERLFSNEIVVLDSVTTKYGCGLKRFSVLNFSYSFFADTFTYSAALLYFPIKCNSSILVILQH